MNITCLNCGHEIDEARLDSGFRDGHDADKPIWILDEAIRCTNCEIVMGRSLSSNPQKSIDWDYHRSTNLDIVEDLTEAEIEAAQSKLSKYPSMTRDLSQLLSRCRPGDRTVRYNFNDKTKTALAVIRGDGVLGVFTTLVDL